MLIASEVHAMTEKGIEQLKEREGFRPMPHPDGKEKGRMSIGYGVNNHAHPEIFEKCEPPITEEEGDKMVREVLHKQEKDLAGRFGPDWIAMNNGQRDALERVAYNCGPSKLHAMVSDAVRSKDWNLVSKKIRETAPSGHIRDKKVSLTRYREEDADAFLKASQTYNAPSSQSISTPSIGSAMVAGATVGTVTSTVPVAVFGGTTVSLFTGASVSTGTVQIGIALSFSNPVTALCCVGGFMLAGSVLAVGCAVGGALSSIKEGDEGNEDD